MMVSLLSVFVGSGWAQVPVGDATKAATECREWIEPTTATLVGYQATGDLEVLSRELGELESSWQASCEQYGALVEVSDGAWVLGEVYVEGFEQDQPSVDLSTADGWDLSLDSVSERPSSGSPRSQRCQQLRVSLFVCGLVNVICDVRSDRCNRPAQEQCGKDQEEWDRLECSKICGGNKVCG